jgi:hypothetical protein
LKGWFLPVFKTCATRPAAGRNDFALLPPKVSSKMLNVCFLFGSLDSPFFVPIKICPLFRISFEVEPTNKSASSCLSSSSLASCLFHHAGTNFQRCHYICKFAVAMVTEWLGHAFCIFALPPTQPALTNKHDPNFNL